MLRFNGAGHRISGRHHKPARPNPHHHDRKAQTLKGFVSAQQGPTTNAAFE